ncbi:hypothetical protein B0H13DRAFT_2289270 [Mycena leptocephala]|nr:hypothetical protein B0H13DRAFT_2289270 [Mycena leptocephala]
MLCSMLFICAQVLWLFALPVNLPGLHACYSRRTLDAKYGCCRYPYLSLSVMSAEGETCLHSFVALKIVDSYLGHSDCPVITFTPTICPRPSNSPSIMFTLGPECSWSEAGLREAVQRISHVALLGDVAKCLCESGAAGSGTTKISYVAECLSGSEAAGSGTTMISYVAECLSGSKAAGSGTTIISYVTLCLSGSEAAGSGITTDCIKWNAGNGKNKNKWNAASGKNKLSAMSCINKIFLNSIAINIPLNLETARTWSFAPVTFRISAAIQDLVGGGPRFHFGWPTIEDRVFNGNSLNWLNTSTYLFEYQCRPEEAHAVLTKNTCCIAAHIPLIELLPHLTRMELISISKVHNVRIILSGYVVYNDACTKGSYAIASQKKGSEK